MAVVHPETKRQRRTTPRTISWFRVRNGWEGVVAENGAKVPVPKVTDAPNDLRVAVTSGSVTGTNAEPVMPFAIRKLSMAKPPEEPFTVATPPPVMLAGEYVDLTNSRDIVPCQPIILRAGRRGHEDEQKQREKFDRFSRGRLTETFESLFPTEHESGIGRIVMATLD